MRRIKHPYRDSEDGFVYVRVKKESIGDGFFAVSQAGGRPLLGVYDDTRDGSRIISARKTELAVDDYDYITVCLNAGLRVVFTPLGVRVGTEGELKHGEYEFGQSVREAYHRYIGGLT